MEEGSDATHLLRVAHRLVPGLVEEGVGHEDEALDGDHHLQEGGRLLAPHLLALPLPRAQQRKAHLRMSKRVVGPRGNTAPSARVVGLKRKGRREAVLTPLRWPILNLVNLFSGLALRITS